MPCFRITGTRPLMVVIAHPVRFSTHTDETGEPSFVLYPMRDPSRQRECRSDVVEMLQTLYPGRLFDFRSSGLVLEGTGALVLDRINRVAYAALSVRCNEVRPFG